MNPSQNRHSIDSFFTFLLLLVFALFSLLLSAMGSSIYKNGIAHLNENYTSRTAIAYVSEKIRQHDAAHQIYFSKIGDTEALVLRDSINNESFLTYVYFKDGALRELFVRENTLPEWELGSSIVELSSFEWEPISPNLLRCKAVNEDQTPYTTLFPINSIQEESST